MKPWGVAIPGLAMAAAELPDLPGLIRLENPEIGDGPALSAVYTLEDVAAMHLKTIRENFLETDRLTVVGFSMGAMIAAVLASEHRTELPKQTAFRFLAASANSVEHPAAPDSMLEAWRSAVIGEPETFRPLLEPFFSAEFRSREPEKFAAFVRYRAAGENRQTAKAFRCQTAALRAFRGAKHFGVVDPSEAVFIAGADDRIFGPAHAAELKKLLPQAEHREIASAGHMLNLEQPVFWRQSLTSG